MSINKIYIFFLLFFGLAVYLFFKDSLAIWNDLSMMNFQFIIYGFLVNLLCVSLDFFNWMFYLKNLPSEKIFQNNDLFPLKKFLSIHLAGFSIDILPAKVGTFSRAILLNHLCHIPKRKGFAVQGSALLTDLIAAVIISSIMAFIVIDISNQQLQLLGIILFITSIALLIGFKYQGFGLKKFAHYIFASLLKSTHQESIKATKNQFLALFTLKNLRYTLSIKLLSWCLLGVSFALVLYAFGYSIDLQKTILAVSVSAIIGGLSMLPGGLGTTDLSLFGFCILWNIPTEISVLIVFSYRLISFWYLIFVGNLISQYLLIKHNQRLDANNHSI